MQLPKMALTRANAPNILCFSSASKGSPMAATVLTRGEHGKSVDAKVGDSILVQLAELPTAGYAWADRSAGDVIALETSDYAPAAAGAVGGAGVRTFRFGVRKPGTATLSLKLGRKWEPEASASDAFSVTVRATQP
jgi:inhibitor of cysteine peptidase